MNRRLAPFALVLLPIVVGAMVIMSRPGVPLPSVAPAETATSRLAPSPTPIPEARIDCHGEANPLPSILASDPCPDAITAVELAVAPVRLPIERIVLEPGPFFCDVVWPGAQTTSICPAIGFLPGQFMHGWVGFHGSAQVAAVMLGLDLPADIDAPGATRPPWHATVVQLVVPPAGWVMP